MLFRSDQHQIGALARLDRVLSRLVYRLELERSGKIGAGAAGSDHVFHRAGALQRKREGPADESHSNDGQFADFQLSRHV